MQVVLIIVGSWLGACLLAVPVAVALLRASAAGDRARFSERPPAGGPAQHGSARLGGSAPLGALS